MEPDKAGSGMVGQYISNYCVEKYADIPEAFGRIIKFYAALGRAFMEWR